VRNAYYYVAQAVATVKASNARPPFNLELYQLNPELYRVTGTILNAVGIIVGGLLALTLRRQPTATTQLALKAFLGMAAVFVGLRLTWLSMGGGFWMVGKQLLILVLALTFGRLAGQLLGLQKAANKLGHYARQKVSATSHASWSEGFSTGAILYCATPLAIVGSVLDGLSDQWQPLAVKAVIDGLATMAFTTIFGWSIVLAVVPVIAWQGTLALLTRLAVPLLTNPVLLDAINATGGMLVFCVALVILELKKIELADYLPSLLFAPLIAWLWQ
jgi:uncharacterized membrane protein YqgA involved in biofilm formation